MSDREIMDAKFSKFKTPSPSVSRTTKPVQPNIEYMPNQKLHRNVSFIKSGVRILGFGLCWWSLDIGVTVLILAEVIGVGEELV